MCFSLFLNDHITGTRISQDLKYSEKGVYGFLGLPWVPIIWLPVIITLLFLLDKPKALAGVSNDY